MPAWNGWYHLMANTYGTWAAGDGRGFRTRHHREHIEGDYKHPPPAGKYEARLQQSRTLMKRDSVLLNPAARVAAVDAIVAAMQFHEIELLVVSVSATHLHLLGRFPASVKKKPTVLDRGLRTSALDDPPRHYLGIAKKESAKALVVDGLVDSGGVWAKRGKVKPIQDRAHEVRVYGYVVAHLEEGAAVWCHRWNQVRMREI